MALRRARKVVTVQPAMLAPTMRRPGQGGELRFAHRVEQIGINLFNFWESYNRRRLRVDQHVLVRRMQIASVSEAHQNQR